ncbi:uncharacterized protein BDR25DRAFT_356429 [Lindgomyces ingoldianus]|uniref:Uncharacterized protein n=1 Tax=Lindgomyces ingoldianus TaxID=673940 RepID=A0ACB6QRQ9_9PLEO|nr:uncharacterized protein BDR25DRAFT_356429 [Lindgomyces ingoldianus]KAF2469689.1 hypothetical protein BDR25DRAFT_356429 [Lindgomyces ingoldianus]
MPCNIVRAHSITQHHQCSIITACLFPLCVNLYQLGDVLSSGNVFQTLNTNMKTDSQRILYKNLLPLWRFKPIMTSNRLPIFAIIED